MDDDAVIEAARAIRPYLDRLADPPATADELDRHLADALNGRSDRPAAARRLRILLKEQEDMVPGRRTALPAALPSAPRPSVRGGHPRPGRWPRPGRCRPLHVPAR